MTVCKEENVLNLWKRSELTSPLHTFSGSPDSIVSCDMATISIAGDINCKLISLTRENDLCLWEVPHSVVSVCIDNHGNDYIN